MAFIMAFFPLLQIPIPIHLLQIPIPIQVL